MKWLSTLLLLTLLIASTPVYAGELKYRYIQIFNKIEGADILLESGKTNLAKPHAIVCLEHRLCLLRVAAGYRHT